MTTHNNAPLEIELDAALAQASAPPMMPGSLQHVAMDHFPARKTSWAMVATSLGALAASVALGFGGLNAWQNHQVEQAAIAADADAFAQELIEGDLSNEL